MDGDLQNDPADIPMLVEKLNEGYDVVSGWRKNRQDNAIRRNLPSRIANALISKVSGVSLHDHGCTLKAFRANVLQGVRLDGEMHRFISVYASWQGARVIEVPVRHHARRHGQSNYGLGRIIKVLLDLLVVKFLGNYTTKPIYLFGTAGILCIALSMLSGFYAIYMKIFEATSFILTPLPLLSVFTFLTGVVCILMGLLAELMVRIYFEGQDKTPYVIRNTTNIKNQD
jgi:dolichol-phosphate mannosyltransferase